ncbi:protein CANDIDATE G-PROTEIN COUPLED RECEPTOR 2 [Eucalyptus grandis]|uniref:protein CANDIDATE G-PROTEIN COUPLED RECEPTOR 2 n=1 Tax=Eucalyptus grandis TaxID=71139 RepID=UPI00192EA076|nr:protein CANDIDATE G-PROTEIN COUPLED RECEPTOR 2 [Eucalyptus grandis]
MPSILDRSTNSSPSSPPPLPPAPVVVPTAQEPNATSPDFSPVCPGFFYDAVLVVAAALFVLFLAYHAKRNLKKLFNGRSHVMISYYALLWVVSLLNLAWCSLQAWQCTPGSETGWNILSLFTKSGLLCMEISLVAFLLQGNYANGLEALSRTFRVTAMIIGVDILLKAVYVFGFRVPLFFDVGSTHIVKWALWSIHEIVITAVYSFVLFIRFSKWTEELPPRPAFYRYIVVMFVINSVALLACMLAGIGAGFGTWLYSLIVICYHALYLPFLYVIFLADFFKEEDFLLDNAYYSEMKDAGFFDADWD